MKNPALSGVFLFGVLVIRH